MSSRKYGSGRLKIESKESATQFEQDRNAQDEPCVAWLSKEPIHPGDCVVIAGPTNSKKYIGRISSFHKKDFSDEVQANISWFFSQHEIPKKFRSKDFHKKEVFLATPVRVDSIDLDSILCKCSVKWIHPDSTEHRDFDVNEFFYRRSFDGKTMRYITSAGAHESESRAETTIQSPGKRARQTPLRHGDYTTDDLKIASPPKKSKTRQLDREFSEAAKRSPTGELKMHQNVRQPFKAKVSAPSASAFGKVDASAVLDFLNYCDENSLPIRGVNASESSTPTSIKPRKSSVNIRRCAAIPMDTDNSDVISKPTHKVLTNPSSNDVQSLTLKTASIMLNSPPKPLQSSLKKRGGGKENNFHAELNVPCETNQNTSSWAVNSSKKSKVRSKLRRNLNDDYSVKKTNKKSSKKKITFSASMTDSPKKSSKKVDSGTDDDRSCVVSNSELSESVRKSSRLRSKTYKKLVEPLSPDEESLDDASESDFSADACDASSDEDVESDTSYDAVINTPSKQQTKRKSMTKSKAAITPIKLKVIKQKHLLMPSRVTPVKHAKGNLGKARGSLHVSAVPDCLPCRENQFEEVYSFVEGKIRSGGGGCMYISGVPGTGKTATVQEVMKCLRDASDDGQIPGFTFIDINGMRLTEPRQAYVQLLRQLNGQKATADHAADLLSQMFAQRRKVSTVVLADELDLLWTRKQDVLYHLFNWPTHRHAKLIVVAIANTMDLPERIMMNRVSSRLGLTRLTFRPYNFKQLQEIVSSRLKGLNSFDEDAVQLASRKVAAISGDARRCLDICRRATELAEFEHKTEVGVEHVHEALKEMFATPMILAIRSCSRQEQLFLRAVVSEFRRSGVEEATLGMVVHQHAALCQLEGAAPVSVSTVVQMSQRLAESRLVLLEGGRRDLYSRVRLNVSADDVLFALKE